MGVLFRRRARDDQTTHSLLRSGVYRLYDVEDEEGQKFQGAKVAYSFWSAAKYTFILTVLLWWLPVFGQMIAGYVGGRRAGTPGRAILAALFPLIFIFGISYAFDSGIIPSEINGITIDPQMLMSGAGENVPFVGPYLAFATMYINSWMGAVQSITLLKVDNYIVTIAFAYIGGIIADQTRREMEFVAARSGHETNIVVGHGQSPVPASTRARALRYTNPARHPEEEASFEGMSSLPGEASAEGGEEVPVRVTRRSFSKREAAGAKKGGGSKARLMERSQKEVERRVKGRPSVNGLVARSAKKVPPKPHVPSGEQDGSSGWEYI